MEQAWRRAAAPQREGRGVSCVVRYRCRQRRCFARPATRTARPTFSASPPLRATATPLTYNAVPSRTLNRRRTGASSTMAKRKVRAFVLLLTLSRVGVLVTLISNGVPLQTSQNLSNLANFETLEVPQSHSGPHATPHGCWAIADFDAPQRLSTGHTKANSKALTVRKQYR